MIVVGDSVMLQSHCCIAGLQASEKQLLSCKVRQGTRGRMVSPHWALVLFLLQSMSLSTPCTGGHAPSRGVEGLSTLWDRRVAMARM